MIDNNTLSSLTGETPEGDGNMSVNVASVDGASEQLEDDLVEGWRGLVSEMSRERVEILLVHLLAAVSVVKLSGETEVPMWLLEGAMSTCEVGINVREKEEGGGNEW